MDKEKIKYRWLEFSQGYLLLSKLACQELIDERENKHSKITKFDPKEFSSIKYQPEDIFVPIVFNIKHGIEIFIKTLCIYVVYHLTREMKGMI